MKQRRRKDKDPGHPDVKLGCGAASCRSADGRSRGSLKVERVGDRPSYHRSLGHRCDSRVAFPVAVAYVDGA